MNFRKDFFKFSKKHCWNLVEIALNLLSILGSIDILAISGLTIYEHGIPFSFICL
jgi:hypothetical protein